MTNRNRMLLSLAVSAAALPAAPAWAQDAALPTLGDDAVIVVTATKREASLLDVPFSVNTQSEKDIQRAAATTLEDVARNVAGLTVQNLGPGQSQVSIRGVSAGQIVRDQPGVKEQVGIYLDESVVSLSLFTPDIDLYDLNRIETLRGPQGTLFGSGSVGGTVRFITNQPDVRGMEGSLEGNLNVLAGGDVGGHLKGMINFGNGSDLAVRAVGYYTQYGGFIDATGPAGGEDVNDGSRVGGRIAVAFEPSDGIRITPRVVYQEVRADGFNRQEVFNFFASPFTVPPYTPEEREQHLGIPESYSDDFLLADLTAEADLTEDFTLTSISSYLNRDILVSRDKTTLTGSVSLDLGFPAETASMPSALVDTTDLETFSQELRVAFDNLGAFDGVIGVYYMETDRFYRQRSPTPGYDAVTDAVLGAGTSAAAANGFPVDSPYSADVPYDITQFAVFGEGTYDISYALHLTVGGRYYDFSEERRFTSGGITSNVDDETDETSSSGFNPRLILSWDAADNVRVNAQASKGFRLGGVNDPLNLPLCSPGDAALFGGREVYDDESLWNYEIGVRTQGRALRFSAAAFYTEISNLQVTLDAGTCSSRIVFNVPEAHTMGLEAELSANPIAGLALTLGGSWVEAEFDSSLPGANATVTGIREGNRLPTVPEFQLAASATYSFAVGQAADGYVGAAFQYMGSRYTQPADQENNPRNFVSGLAFNGATGLGVTTVDLKLPAYEYVNLSAGIDWDNGLGVMVYMTNLFDENALLSFDRERGGRARLGFNVGQPRTAGVAVRKAF
jgi:iron complex outermembrane recepter protein